MELRNSYLENAVKPATGLVYHYTGAQALLGVVPSGRIRASQASSLNDIAEIRQGWDALKRLIPRLPESDERDLMQSIADGQHFDDPHRVYILSASTLGDDANQWRLYAEEARGYAIAFDGTQQLAALTDEPLSADRRSGIFATAADAVEVTPWLHVMYTDEAVLEALEAVHAEIVDDSATMASIPDEEVDVRNDYGETIRERAIVSLETIAHLIKGPGFAGENEVRVVANFVLSDAHRVHYHPGRIGIVGYATLTQAPDGHDGDHLLRPTDEKTPYPSLLPIKSISIGPLLPPEHRETILGFVRDLNQREIDVVNSNVPLRA